MLSLRLQPCLTACVQPYFMVWFYEFLQTNRKKMGLAYLLQNTPKFLLLTFGTNIFT